MNSVTDFLYPAGSVREKRLGTDCLFVNPEAEMKFDGAVEETARFLEKMQLTDSGLWKRFAEQFRLHSDSADNGWRGEFWGKMMRGGAFVWSYTRSEELFRVLTDAVEDILGIEAEDGRVSSYRKEKEFCGWDVWCRKYILLGMQYYLEICRDAALKERILGFLCRQADLILAAIGPGKLAITATAGCWRGLASSSVLEPMVRMYDLTGEKKYLEFASYLVSIGGTDVANLYELAYEDRTDPYQYPVTKAYEMISCFEGLLEYYRATGDEHSRTAVENFGRRLLKSEMTVIGGCGCTHEYLDHGAARQSDTAYRGIMLETCVTVTFMKFCGQMLLLTGETAYADALERALYNAYLGAVNTEARVNAKALEACAGAAAEALPFDSYSPLHPDVRGRAVGGLKMMPDRHVYGCCACIGAAGIGLAARMSSLLSKDGVAVNLYLPGKTVTRTPEGKGLTLLCDTRYPAEGEIVLQVCPAAPESFALALRIPAWSRSCGLYVNGEPVHAVRGKYAVITRTWETGDTVRLCMDMHTYVIHPEENPKDLIFTGICWSLNYIVPRVVYASEDALRQIALQRGPLVLARDRRLGGEPEEPVDVAYDPQGAAFVSEAPAPGFACRVCLDITQKDGSTFRVTDYASAGKTWSEESRFACWLPAVTDRYGRKGKGQS